MKKHALTLIALLGLCLQLSVQAQAPFQIRLQEITVTDAPGLQSYAAAESGYEWLLIGGRTDGLHQRQPFAAFLESDNNTMAYVLNPVSGQVWSASLSSLPASIFEQIQSTNMEFEQWNGRLYLIGGYGYSATQQDHYTYPALTVVEVDSLIQAIKTGGPVAPWFRQIQDNRLQVTGGYLDRLDSTFYLVGGQNFLGRYNPMGPTHGPGFFQEYSNEIRTFQIDDDGQNLSITNYSATRDTVNLHRRDYNLVPQHFPGGQTGFTAFSGVFQYGVDLPYLNCVDIRPGTYQVRNDFSQYLSQYHSARLPVWADQEEKMHTVFFGGMAQFTYDFQNNLLVEDQNVPFVKTISRVTRFPNDSLVEYALSVEMPALLGSGAEFFPAPGQPFDAMGILQLDQLAAGEQMVGFIYGGIESTAENIFFVNDGSQSHASGRVFEVYINKGSVSRDEVQDDLLWQLWPNPAKDSFHLAFYLPENMDYRIDLLNTEGKVVRKLEKGQGEAGRNELYLEAGDLSAGMYLLRVNVNGKSYLRRLILQ